VDPPEPESWEERSAMTTLAGRTALITGGASGLGRLLGAELARRGSRVILWDIDEDRLRSTTVIKARVGSVARPSSHPDDPRWRPNSDRPVR